MKKAGPPVAVSFLFLFLFLLNSVFSVQAAEKLPTRADAYFWNQIEKMPVKLIPLKELSFKSPEDAAGWRPMHQCSLEWKDGALVIHSTGNDPYALAPGNLFDVPAWEDGEPKNLIMRLTMRGEKNHSVGIYWVDDQQPNFSEDLHGDALSAIDLTEWKTVDVPLTARAPIRTWRLDSGLKAGRVEIQKIEFLEVVPAGVHMELLPMESVRSPLHPEGPMDSCAFPKEPQTVRVLVKSQKNEPQTVRVNGKDEAFGPKEERIFTFVSDPKLPVQKCVWEVEAEGFEPIRREVTLVHDAEITSEWKVVRGKNFDFCLNYQNGIAFLCRDGKKIAALTDLIPEAPISVKEDRIEIPASKAGDLPNFRIPGKVNLAILPGLELLEKDEWSSSRADLVIPAHARFRPEPYLLTQSWLGAVTSDGTFRLHWENPDFQPTFAVPNYFDSTPDLRFGVDVPKELGTLAAPETVTLFFSPSTDESAFLRAALKEELKTAKRTSSTIPEGEEEMGANREKLFALYREQLENGVIRGEEGWGHCAGDHWRKSPFGDMASALEKVGGKAPDFSYGGGGAHVSNNYIFFVRNQAERWFHGLMGAAENALRTRNPDGNWNYAGKYDVTHFEATALGRAAQPCRQMLTAYALSGEKKFLDAALESLALCRRFHVGRGAQCWEMPLHTPDPLACAHAVQAYVWAFRITGDVQYLKDAERWALEGAAYIYLWDKPNYPWQFGSYIGVLGATNWEAPNWLGRPVQWIGTVYAHALLDYADVLRNEWAADLRGRNQVQEAEGAVEDAEMWRQLAEWITLSTERQIYQSGEFAGLLPDSIDFRDNLRYPWNINPAVPIALRLRLDGELDSLDIKWNEKYRIASPFPMVLEGDSLRIQAPKDLAFQILVNGKAHLLEPAEETERTSERIVDLKALVP